MRYRFLAAGLLGILLPCSAQAVETYDGSAFLSLARQSVDVMRLHQDIAQSELNQDRVLNHLSLTMQSSPARFAHGDGTQSKGGLGRFLFSVGGGFGKPSSAVSAAAGVDTDIAYTSQFPVLFKRGGPSASWMQALMYGRLAVYGFSAHAGYMFNQSEGIDAYGQFTGKVEPVYRPGTPDDVENVSKRSSGAVVVSVRHKEGVGLGLSYADLVSALPDGRTVLDRGLATVRAQVAPEHLLPREFGVLGVGLDRLAGELDYYLDRYQAARNAVASASTPQGAVAQFLPSKPIYELPLSMDNIGSIGARAKIVPQVSPSAKLRMVEIAWTTAELGDDLPFVAGARFALFSRNDRYAPAVNLYAGVRVPEMASSWSLSYSYNLPDSATFFPIPNVHVLGFQYVLGALESAPALIPTVVRRSEGK